MSEISGISTDDIENVNGFFVTSGGGSSTATTTPTITVSTTTLGNATITVGNHGSLTLPQYKCHVEAGGAEIIGNDEVAKNVTSNQQNGTLTFSDSSGVTGQRTIKVRAQNFGDFIQSAEASATYSKGSITKRYIRFRGVTESGAVTSSRLGIGNIRFFTGGGQSGTEYPTTNLTSNTSETGIVVSQGRLYSSSYDAWKAGDTSLTTMAWLLGASSSQNWWMIEFESGTYSTPPTISSIQYKAHNQSAGFIRIEGSDTGAFAGEQTDFGVYKCNNNVTHNYG